MRNTSKPLSSEISSENKTGGLNSILHRLIKPAASIREQENRQRARLLSGLLAAQFLLSALVTIIILFTDRFSSNIYIGIVTTFVLFCAYFLSRTSKYNLAALIEVGTLSGAVFVTEIIAPDPSSLYFLILGVLVSSLFLPRRHTIVLMAITILGIGLLLWVHYPALPVRDTIGAMFAVLCVGVPGIVVTTMRQQDQQEIQLQSIALQQSEDRFRMVTYATNDVVWDWDLSTGHIWRNQNAGRLFGFREDEMRPVIGWWEEHIHPDEREKTIRSLYKAIENNETFWSNEYRFRRADDSYIHVFDRAYIIHDESSGKPIRVIGARMDITPLKQAEEILRQESLRDPLTGLFNRRYMEEMLDREFHRAKRTSHPISIIMLDVDRFKQVNDTLGHAAGDALLHTLGNLLLGHVRGTDIACRYGGDEFILILPGATLAIARQRAEKICLDARGLIVEPYGNLAKIFSLSIGVAVFPEQGATRDAIFLAADAALYAAKAAGRNQVVVANGQATMTTSQATQSPIPEKPTSNSIGYESK